jgi:hypothetical protein
MEDTAVLYRLCTYMAGVRAKLGTNTTSFIPPLLASFEPKMRQFIQKQTQAIN